MTTRETIDCITIGYNEPPFSEYVDLIRRYGDDSEAVRDLQFSYVDLNGTPHNYIDLMNHVFDRAQVADDLRVVSGEIPNLAAVYLTNCLRRRGHRAEYINLFQFEKARLASLLAERTRCVAITTTFYVLNFPVIEIVEFIRRHNPEVKIVVGGPLIANHARNYRGEELRAALRDLGADIYVVESQGEHTLSQIVQCLKDSGDLKAVPNLIIRDRDDFITSAPVAEWNSLDENAIDWYRLSPDDLGATLQTRTARSCAFKCAFCNYPTRAGRLTLMSTDAIENELDSMARRGNVQNVVFIDDTFNVPLPRFKDICRLMIRKGYGFNWFSYFRCSNSDEEAVELMAESGCKGVFLGIESGSPAILANMNKRATVEKYSRGIELLRERDILTFGSFILGFPGETPDTAKETLDFIRATEVDYYRIQMWYNEIGTPIHEQREKFEIEGDGFVWSHSTMDSQEAMDHIERSFLSIDRSEWLPQWSFDFWIIPYMLGKGISRRNFKDFMKGANRLLRLEIASLPDREKRELQEDTLESLTQKVSAWDLPASRERQRQRAA